MLAVRINPNGELIASRCVCVPDGRTITQTRTADLSVSTKKASYGEILKSSALVGGSSVLKIAIGIVRTKAMALLLGPAGFGLFGLYGSITDLTQSIAGMGVNSSGVRQIAEAVGTGNSQRVSLTTVVLRRTSVVLGVIGGALLLVFSRHISKLTFGDKAHAPEVALLSLVVAFGLISNGQTALIQGMRRISDLAKISVIGAFTSLCVSVPLVYFLGQRGIVPALIAAAAMTILTSWWYSRRVGLSPMPLSFSDVRHEASSLLKLGSAFMASGLMMMGVGYLVRIMILRQLGFEATGLYQSAWTLGGLYVGFILQAMSADFYPRLTANIGDRVETNRLVNEQTLVGLLLAGPGVLTTLTFAPLVITVFYSAKFGAAVGILRWICLGATLQVITWPMGFIIVAKGNQVVFFLAELAWTVTALVLAFVCIRFFGLDGAGIAFFGSYVFHLLLIYPIVRSMSGFRWSPSNLRNGTLFLLAIALVFNVTYFLPFMFSVPLGTIAIFLATWQSLRTIFTLVSIDTLPNYVQQLVRKLGFVKVQTATS
jgi:PST family polysaccharide transporter